MKNIVLKSLSCLAAVALMASCNDTMDDKADIDAKYAQSFEAPTFAVVGVENVTHNSATVNLSLSDTTYVVEQGIQISKTSDFSDASNIWVDKAEETAALEIEGLEAETTYYVRPYIYMVNGSYAAGQATSFTTAEPPAESWTPAFVGTYTYSLLWQGDDEGLILYSDDIHENRYKIENWGGGVDLIFTMAEDGELFVEEQEVGAEYGSYGPIYVSTGQNYWGSDYNPETDYSVYDSGVFYFNMVYHVAAGTMNGWYGDEKFTLTGKASAKSRNNVPNMGKKMKTVSDFTPRTWK